MAQSADTDVLRNVEKYLDTCGVSFASLVIGALRDPESSSAKDLITRITDVFDALRPNLDANSVAELGRFFASIASSELSELREDDLWHLPATRLSAGQLQKFSMKKMSQQIATEAPGFSSFLHSICVSKRALSEAVAEDDETGVRPEARRSVDPAQLLDIRKTTITNIILNARSRKCNAFQVALGVYLHSTNTPDKVISTLHHAGFCVSQASISRAITSLSAEALTSLSLLGRSLLIAYAYDNFDVLLKALVPTVENNTDPLKHLTSGLIFPLQHDVQLDDLRISTDIWEKYEFNDMSESAHKVTRSYMWTTLIPRYRSLVAPVPGSPLPRHTEFKVWILLRDLIESGPDYFKNFRNVLQYPEPIEERIPVEKTEIIPVQSMEIPNSTVEGNITTIEKLLEQTGLAELQDERQTIDIDPYIILFHGDLGTGERLQSAKRRRTTEASPRNRLQYAVFVMGLFHLKMACAETIWRLFLKDSKARTADEKTSFYSNFKILRPRDSSGLSTSFKFRPIHEAIIHIGACRRLDCWRMTLEKRGFSSLQKFVDTCPTWDLIKEVALEVANEFIPNVRRLASLREEDLENRDQELENNLAFNLYAGMYEEITYAMNYGDIGRVELCLLQWVPLFEAVGKRKYANQTLKLVYELNHIFPPRASRAIRMNILINPTGRPGRFRAVDWAVELLNLFTKVTHSGKFSNKSIEHILNESPLIETYRHLHEIFDESFYNSKKTTVNNGPDMAKTYTELLKLIESECTHTKIEGRRSGLDAGSMVDKGILSILATSKSTKAEGTAESENDDLQAEILEEAEFDDEDLMLDDV